MERGSEMRKTITFFVVLLALVLICNAAEIEQVEQEVKDEVRSYNISVEACIVELPVKNVLKKGEFFLSRVDYERLAKAITKDPKTTKITSMDCNLVIEPEDESSSKQHRRSQSQSGKAEVRQTNKEFVKVNDDKSFWFEEEIEFAVAAALLNSQLKLQYSFRYTQPRETEKEDVLITYTERRWEGQSLLEFDNPVVLGAKREGDRAVFLILLAREH